MGKSYIDTLKYIAEDMRRNVSDYCVSDCNATCCKSGAEIDVDERDALNVFGDHIIGDVLHDERIRETDPEEAGEYSIRLNPCPSIGRNDRCGIYNIRPTPCRTYPVSLEETEMRIRTDCKAVSAGVLDGYILKLSNAGVNVTGGRERVVFRDKPGS